MTRYALLGFAAMSLVGGSWAAPREADHHHHFKVQTLKTEWYGVKGTICLPKEVCNFPKLLNAQGQQLKQNFLPRTG
jgi:hypothetical protein